MYSLKPDLNKQNILSKITEWDIFRFYCKNFVEPNKAFCAEQDIRCNDTNASCRINNYRGKILYYDFGKKEGMSCFDYVMCKFHVDYINALKIINRDFKLNLDSEINLKVPEPIIYPNSFNESYNNICNGNSIIRVCYKDWDLQSIQYLKDYKLDYRRVSSKFKVNPIDWFWINDYRFKAVEVSFASYFGLDEERYLYKIYQPLSDKKKKWFHNLHNGQVMGLEQLPTNGELLILTKSYKDVWCYDNFEIPSISPGAEGWDISEIIMDSLFDSFEHIIVNYDFDYVGIRSMNKLKRRYGLRCITLTNGKFNTFDYGHKDFADYCKHNTIEDIQRLINNFKQLL